MVERSIATPASKRALRATPSDDIDVVLQSFAIEFNRLLPWLVYLVPIIHFSHFISFIKHRICTLSLCSLCLACIYCIIQGVQDMTVCLGHILMRREIPLCLPPSLPKLFLPDLHYLCAGKLNIGVVSVVCSQKLLANCL